MTVMDSIISFFQKKSNLPKKGRSLEELNLRRLMPIGEVLGDGCIQISFVLPVKASEEARIAAQKYVERLGLKQVDVVGMEAAGKNLSNFVVQAQARHALDFTKIKPDVATLEQGLSLQEIHEFASDKIKRRLSILAIPKGGEEHSLGLDTMINYKGHLGEPGLEAYAFFKTYHLRQDMEEDAILKKILNLKADILLIGHAQAHRAKGQTELKDLAKLLKASKKLKENLVKVVEGPQMNHLKAQKLGFDGGFASGALPNQVAEFILKQYIKKNKVR